MQQAVRWGDEYVRGRLHPMQRNAACRRAPRGYAGGWALDVLLTRPWPRLSLWRLSTPQPAICVRRPPTKEEQEQEQETQK